MQPRAESEIDLRADHPENGAPGASAVPYTQPFHSSQAFVYIQSSIYFHLSTFLRVLTMGLSSRFLRIPRPEVSLRRFRRPDETNQ